MSRKYKRKVCPLCGTVMKEIYFVEEGHCIDCEVKRVIEEEPESEAARYYKAILDWG
jgi:uncharacterized Zn ribbon protein